MIAQLLFFFGAVLVLTGLIPNVDWLYVYMGVTQLLLTMVVHFGHRHYPRWALITVVALLLGSALLVWGQVVGMAAPIALTAILLVLLLLVLGWNSYASLFSAAAVALPSVGLLQLWSTQGDEATTRAGSLLLLWTLALWPCLGLLAKGRLWSMASTFGCAGLLSVMAMVIHDAGARSVLLVDILTTGWRYGDPLLAVGQVALVLVSVIPLLLESTRFWRVMSLSGGLGVSVSVLLVWLAGPWPDGLPVIFAVILTPALITLMIGGVGLLCTVQRPDLLATTAVRALALGVGASAVLLLPSVVGPIEPTDLLPTLSMAISPMVWGGGLALFMAVAGNIAQRREAPVVDTDRLQRSKVRAAHRLRTTLSGYVSGLMASVATGRRRWWSPEAVIPLLFCLSSYPSWYILDPWQFVIVALLAPSILIRSMVDEHLLLWSLCQSILLATAAMLLGASMLVAVALVAAGIPCCWLFLRWASVNAAWAFPGSLLLLVVLWLPWMQGGAEPVLVATGLLILVANAFLSGPARWVALPLASVAGLAFLWLWIPHIDRYVQAVFDDSTIWEEALQVGTRMPMAFILLLILLLNREEDRLLVPVFDDSTRTPVYSIAVLVALAWALGYRPDPIVGVIIAGVAVFGVTQSFRSVPMIEVRCLRWPILDGMAMMLASVLVAVGGAYATWQQKVAAGEAMAGALGDHLLKAQYDVVAVVLAIGAVVLLHRWLDWYMVIERRLHREGGLGSLG